MVLSRWMRALSLVLFALSSVLIPCQCFARREEGVVGTHLPDEGDGQPDKIDHNNGEFLHQLFLKYGDDSGRISFRGFVELVGSIGLGGHDATDLPGVESERRHHHHIEWHKQDPESTGDQYLDEETATSGEVVSPAMPLDQDRDRDGGFPGPVRPTKPVVGTDSKGHEDGDSGTESEHAPQVTQVRCFFVFNLSYRNHEVAKESENLKILFLLNKISNKPKTYKNKPHRLSQLIFAHIYPNKTLLFGPNERTERGNSIACPKHV